MRILAVSDVAAQYYYDFYTPGKLGLLDKYRPKYFVHGHVHRNYGIKIPQRTQRGETVIINVFDHCTFDC